MINNMKKDKKSIIGLKEDFKNGIVSSKSIIARCKKDEEMQKDVYLLTTFLDDLNREVDLIERLYYILNDISQPEFCPYCNNLKTFTGRFKEGYRPTCNNKECQSKNYTKLHTGLNIKEGRDNNFDVWQNKIDESTELNDEIILQNFFLTNGGLKRSVTDKISNPHLIRFLNQRYNDSYSFEETVRRIKLGIEEKPKCLKCGKPVVFVGKDSKMFTEYCSLSCSNSADEVLVKKQTSDRAKNNGVLGWNINTPEKIEKRKETLTERYGTTNIYDVSVFKQKVYDTNMERYGVPHIMQTEDAKRRRNESLMKNPFWGSGISRQEQELYDELVKIFPSLIHQYTSEEYPFLADFYLPEKNLYIEWQGSQYHHFHPFNEKDIQDQNELQRLREKSATYDGNNQYAGIINQWTIRDVNRRKFVEGHNINWLEFFPNNTIREIVDTIIDFIPKNLNINFSKKELQKEFEYYQNASGNLLASPKHNKIVLQYQQKVFYRKEREFLSEVNNWEWMKENRQKYLNKESVSLLEMYRGCKISGKVFGFSHFSPLWIKWFCEQYNIKSLFDPCGGWGHRMLGCLNLDRYIYNDINSEVCQNIEQMVKDFRIKNAQVNNYDIRLFPNDIIKGMGVDAWFTCPPYVEKDTGRNIEHYDCGDYSVQAYAELLKTMIEKWLNSDSKHFGLVIREDMFNDYIEPILNNFQNIEHKIEHIFKSSNTHLVQKSEKKHREVLVHLWT